MQKQLRPLQDKLIVKRSEVQTTSPGGIIIPEKAKRLPQEGTVIAIGPGRLLRSGAIHPVAVKVGEVVMFDTDTGIPIPGDKEHVILGEDDLLCTVAQ